MSKKFSGLKSRRLCQLFIPRSLVQLPRLGDERQWRAKSGSSSTIGDLIGINGNEIVLRTPTRIIFVDSTKLSNEDQAYLQSLRFPVDMPTETLPPDPTAQPSAPVYRPVDANQQDNDPAAGAVILAIAFLGLVFALLIAIVLIGPIFFLLRIRRRKDHPSTTHPFLETIAHANSLVDEFLRVVDRRTTANHSSASLAPTEIDRLRLIQKKAGSLRTRLDQKCRIGLIGEFSSGKSTLVNALVRDEVLESGVIQGTTLFEVRVRHGNQKRITLVRHDQSHQDLQTSVLSKRALEEANVRPDARGVLSATIHLPAEILEHNIELIDLPGIDCESQRQVNATIEGMRSSCDAFIVTTASTQPLSENLLGFLHENLVDGFERCLFVITKTDLLRRKNDLDGMIENCAARITSELGLSTSPVVLGCAAEIDLELSQGRDPSEGRSSTISAEHIESYCERFASLKERIISHAKEQQVAILRKDIRSILEQLETSLSIVRQDPFAAIGFHDRAKRMLPVATVQAKVRAFLQKAKLETTNFQQSAAIAFEHQVRRETESFRKRSSYAINGSRTAADLCSVVSQKIVPELTDHFESLRTILLEQTQLYIHSQPTRYTIRDIIPDLTDDFRDIQISVTTAATHSTPKPLCMHPATSKELKSLAACYASPGVVKSVVTYVAGMKAMQQEVQARLSKLVSMLDNQLIQSSQDAFATASTSIIARMEKAMVDVQRQYDGVHRTRLSERPNLAWLHQKVERDLMSLRQLQSRFEEIR